MDTHGYSEKCKVLKVSSEAYQLVRKSEHWKEDGRMRTVLALYWTLLCSEYDRVRRLKGSERMTNDTLVNKLQVVGSLVMRMLEDPLYQNIEPNLSALEGRLGIDWYRDLNDIIAGLLEPYNAGDPGVVDKLRVLILCYWSGLISDEECERVSSLDDPEWRSQLQALQNEDINLVLHGRWEEYVDRQADKHRAQLLFTEEFQSKLMEAAIDKGGSVEVEIVKVVTLGPPEAGKTQLKKALTKNVDETKESTPVSTEAEVVMDCFVEEGSNTAWKKLDGRELQTMLCATIENRKYDVSLPNAAQKDTSHWKGQIPLPIIEEKPDNAEHLLETGQMSLDEEVVYSSSSRLSVWGSEEYDEYTDFEITSDSEEGITSDSPVMSTFSMLKERVVRRFPLVFGDNHLNKVRLIHMIDSGGQPAFLDFHPLVATSRALYLLVYNSQEGLSALPALTYRKPTQFPTKDLPNPTQTNLQMIKRSLYTLHHCKERFLEKEKELKSCFSGITFTDNEILPVVIVGSRKSKTCDEDPSSVVETHCCQIPSWKHTQKKVVLVESLDPSCSGVKELREALSQAESKMKLQLPLYWVLCQLMFWSTDDPSLSVLTYHHLQEICMQEKLVSSGEEFLALLTSFHILGLFSCPDIDRMKLDQTDVGHLHQSPVFTKPDVLYQQVSKILEIPFHDLHAPGQKLSEIASLEDLQRSGILTRNSLHLLGVPDTLGSFPGFHTYLLQSLVKWGLAAQVSQDLGLAAQVSQDPLQLFIPSVLPTRSDAHCTLSESPIPQLALAILAEGSDAYYHLPQGLFPHFIVSLMNRHGGGYELRKSKGNAQPHCRDVVTLTKDTCQETEFPYAVCAVDNIDHISVHIIPVLEDESSPQWSPEDIASIIEDMKQSMEEAYSRLYQRSTQPQVILCCPCSLCPLAQQKKHLARVDCERLTLHCLSLECDRPYAKKCSGTMEAILKEMKRAQRKTEPVKLSSSPLKKKDVKTMTQRKREPHKLPTSASKKTDNKTSLKDKPLKKDANMVTKEAGGNRSPPSEEDDVQPSHPTSSKSPEHQHPVLSTPKDFMEHFHKEFLAKGVVKGKMIADKLADEKVIPKTMKKRLAKEDDDYKVASEIFNHMKGQGDYKSLKSLCEIMIQADGMHTMIKLGKKMLGCLEANKGNIK
jgi:hypothetical protein